MINFSLVTPFEGAEGGEVDAFEPLVGGQGDGTLGEAELRDLLASGVGNG